MNQALAAHRTLGAELARTWFLVMLAEAYGAEGQTDQGLHVLAEALATVNKTREQAYEAELYRLKGELSLQQESREHGARGWEQKAEACFLKAIEVAQKQHAKSLELRAVMSLARLRQQQVQDHATRNTQHEPHSRLTEAHRMLAEVYNWFTEGFDTKDLQEAKSLLDALA